MSLFLLLKLMDLRKGCIITSAAFQKRFTSVPQFFRANPNGKGTDSYNRVGVLTIAGKYHQIITESSDKCRDGLISKL